MPIIVYTCKWLHVFLRALWDSAQGSAAGLHRNWMSLAWHSLMLLHYCIQLLYSRTLVHLWNMHACGCVGVVRLIHTPQVSEFGNATRSGWSRGHNTQQSILLCGLCGMVERQRVMPHLDNLFGCIYLCASLPLKREIFPHHVLHG